jgi:hypothetical protein
MAKTKSKQEVKEAEVSEKSERFRRANTLIS